MCAKYSLPPFDWLKLSHHLVSGESTLHEVTLFEARSRIFLPTAESCAALFCCRLAIRAPSEDPRMARRQQNRAAQGSAVGKTILDRASKASPRFVSRKSGVTYGINFGLPVLASSSCRKIKVWRMGSNGILFL